MSKNILITGSTGFVARHLYARLLSHTDYNLILTYRQNKGDYKPHKRLIFEQANLLQPESFDRIIHSYHPDVVIHLAAMARVKDGIDNPEQTTKANLTATTKIADSCISHGVGTLITASSNLAQNAVSVVGITKLKSEQYLQTVPAKATKLISFRVPNVIDSSESVTLIFKKLIENNKPLTITHPDMSRMFITGPRAAEWIHYLMDHGDHRGIYVSYKEPTKITDLAREMIEKSGKRLPITYIGMKEGEKLTEHTFTKADVIPTDMEYLGKLSNNDKL